MLNMHTLYDDNDLSTTLLSRRLLLIARRSYTHSTSMLAPPHPTLPPHHSKAIELITGCYVLVQGNTVAVMGTHKGIKQGRRIVVDCMKNIHPIYHIKELMIRRELEKDPSLATESWDRFLPKFKKRNVKPTLKKSKKIGPKKKEYTPFPNPQQPRQIDLQMESGEYFLSKEEREQRKMEKKQAKQQMVTEQKRLDRDAVYVAPRETVQPLAGNKRKSSEDERTVDDLKQSILGMVGFILFWFAIVVI